MSGDANMPEQMLSPEDLELLAAFRSMTPWTRRKLREAARAYARNWPRHTAPSLRLVIAVPK